MTKSSVTQIKHGHGFRESGVCPAGSLVYRSQMALDRVGIGYDELKRGIFPEMSQADRNYS